MLTSITYYDSTTGVSTFTFQDHKKPELKFTGEAFCRIEDRDMISEKTGLTIAELRATIKVLTHIRDNVIQPKISALKRLYYSINQSKEFDENSYPVKMITKQLKNYEKDLVEIKDEIKATKRELKDYISGKGEFYQKVRNLRKKAENN